MNNKNNLKSSSLLLLLFFTIPTTMLGQFKATGEISTSGFVATGDTLPFWMHTNRRGRISEETSLSGHVSAAVKYPVNKKSRFSAGAGLFFNDALIEEKVKVDEIFLSYGYHWLELTLGRKQEPELYQGLSATNENILWSLNARPLPGIRLETNRPVYLNKRRTWAFEGKWAEYLFANDRHVQDARLHHKKIALTHHTGQWRFKAGMQHFAQWAGTSPYWGEQPGDFKDYLRIIAGREGGETALNGDQVNVLGSHLGSYELHVSRFFSNSSLSFIFNSIFEDGSGSRGANFPDGRYGIFYDGVEQNAWIHGLIYELYYTRNMSQTGPHLFDSYFNNGVYASGWTNNNRVIGLPFMTTNYYEEYPLGKESIRVGNNALLIHHLGIAGAAFKTIPYKVLLSYRSNYGHYRNTGYRTYEYYPPDDPRGEYKLPPKIFSTYAEFVLPVRPVELKFQVAGDFSEKKSTLGAGLSAVYRFKKQKPAAAGIILQD